MITSDQYKQGGYQKYALKKEYINEVHSRTSHNGKVVRGEAGKKLLERKLAKQAYFERNK